MVLENIQFPIPSTYSRIVARILSLQERDLHQLLSGTGLASDILMPGNDTFITGQQQIVILANGQRLMNSAAFGLKLGAQLQPSAHGPLGYLSLSSPDVLSALESFRDYLPMRLPLVDIEITLDEHWLNCAYQVKLEASSSVRCVMCECFVLVIQSLVEVVLGRKLSSAVIEFDYPPPDYHAEYEHYLHSPFHFAGQTVSYRIPASLAHSPNAAGDTEAHKLAEELCNKLLRQAPHTARSMSDRVRTLLLTRPISSVSEESIARALYVSKRTLARRLEQEGHSYRAIKDRVLLDLAQHYLLDFKQSVESVAALLGYHDSSAFRKAFKRWTNMAPSEYRRLHRAVPFEPHSIAAIKN